MQNTNCCPSCDHRGRTREIEILGKKLRVKDYVCSPDGINYRRKPENTQLYLSVCPVSYCPAGCPFCIATGTKTHKKLNIERFRKTMELLRRDDLVGGVKITGGEPFYDAELLDEVVSVLFDIFGFGLEVSISTNGMWLDKIHKIRHLEHVESIHISRHHYDDEINRDLFGGAAVPDGEKLREVINSISYRDIFVFNCMLLKGCIDSPEEAHKFLDFAISVGAPKVGFMACTPINDYASAHRVPYEDVIRDGDESLLFTRGFYDYEFCHCRDGVYVSPGGEIIEFYGRSTTPGGCDYCRGIVYGADDRLRDGFNGDVIV